LLAELPGLYGSVFATPEYFTLYDHPRRLAVCELDEPRHVVVFTRRGATVDVLNKVFDIEPGAADRVLAAIFRAFPEVRRVRIEVKFPPGGLARPCRELLHSAEYVVALPATPGDYEAALGRATRKHLKEYANRLRRLHPGFELRELEPDEITLDFVSRVLAWNKARIAAKGDPWRVPDEGRTISRTWRLSQTYGAALGGFDGDECVAAWLLFFIGPDCWWHTGGFDRTYEDCHLGLLMTSFTIAAAIRRDCRRVHLTWGTGIYKERLGAEPVTAWRASVYRSRLDRALYVRESWELLVAHRRDIYWRLRVRLAVKRRLRVLAGAVRSDGRAAAGRDDHVAVRGADREAVRGADREAVRSADRAIGRSADHVAARSARNGPASRELVNAVLTEAAARRTSCVGVAGGAPAAPEGEERDR
jgi:hypothetical protein